MRILINIMIFLGSALMVYNIVRYGNFVKRSGELEYQSRGKGLLIVPLLLLVFFLIGYLVVGFSGIADLMVAAILFGEHLRFSASDGHVFHHPPHAGHEPCPVAAL